MCRRAAPPAVPGAEVEIVDPGDKAVRNFARWFRGPRVRIARNVRGPDSIPRFVALRSATGRCRR